MRTSQFPALLTKAHEIDQRLMPQEKSQYLASLTKADETD
jgi:hypothetical protein